MDPIIWENEAPELRDPVLVATFSGWNDAASAASAALGAVADSLDNELIARIDPEDFYDFQATRPQIELTEGRMRGVAWPENLIVAGRCFSAEHEALASAREYYSKWDDEEMVGVLDAGFAEAVAQLEPGSWHGPVLSGYGVHRGGAG